MRTAAFVALSFVALAALSPSSARSQSPDEFFEARVRPILTSNCIDCHRDGRARGRLKLSTLADILKGGGSGPAIVIGDPDASLLIQAIRHEDPDRAMPEDAPPLSARDVATMEEWVRMGAPWPDDAPAVTFASSIVAAGEGLTPGAQLFVDRVRPVLEQKCFTCHTDDERGGLRLDSRERVLQGGGRGPALIPGNPEQSLILAALRHEDPDLQMPRNGDPLSAEEIQGFVDWIAAGAEWADAGGPLAIPRRATTAEERQFWSFQPLSQPSVPSAPAGAWSKTDIDRFVRHRHEEVGVEPVGPADKRTLIRRATFDLIGLPPTPKEVEDFLADDAPDAFDKVVERLLASPHYGEQWGRHWLDVTRFGEDDTRGLANDGSGRERYPMAYSDSWVRAHGTTTSPTPRSHAPTSATTGSTSPLAAFSA
jgi:mono/diheme cytochrome c family protein